MLATPNSKGELFLASSLRDGLEDNDIRQVKTLLQSKEADPNVLIPTHGISPFHLVIGNESESFAEEVTKLFLRHGGNPNVRSTDGMTPVHVAAAWGRVKVLELLLANGGDPLCLDDEARSPFHYAFEGGYYDAVAVLGKYGRLSQKEEEEEEEEPKYKLKLQRILIDRGNCVTEYIPSETASSVEVKIEPEDSPKAIKREPLASPTQNCANDSCPSGVPSARDEFSHLNSENITQRRRRYFDSPASQRTKEPLEHDNEKRLNIEFGERSVEEERLLLGEIIDKLSNTYIKDSLEPDAVTSTGRVDNNPEPKADNGPRKKIIRSYLPPPKYHSSDLKREKTPARLIDTSIVSKSPNFRIFSSKTPASSSKKYCTPPSRGTKCVDKKVKSASSTPKRKEYRSRLSGLVKGRPETEKSKSAAVKRELKTRRVIFDKTYRKDLFGVPSYSPDPEMSGRRIDRRLLAKDVAMKLDERLEEDNETRKASGEKNINRFCGKKYDDKSRVPQGGGTSSPRAGARVANGEKKWKDESRVKSPALCSGYRHIGQQLVHSSRTDSFLSVDEEYVYEDAEEGVAFTERRLRVVPAGMASAGSTSSDGFSLNDSFAEYLSASDCSNPAESGRRSPLNERILRERLTILGVAPGPITKTTYDVYLKQLHKRERAQNQNANLLKSQEASRIPKIVPKKIAGRETIFPDWLLTTDWTTRLEEYRRMEEQAFGEYSRMNPRRMYRGGVSKNSFCYLLLDPRITEDLPRSGFHLDEQERWEKFLGAVFYVGQGKRARPDAHLYDALKVWSSGRRGEEQMNRKTARIMEIWKSGLGVVCHHVFMNTMVEEACTREAAMIDTLDLNHLTNCNRGTYYGYAVTMNTKEKRKLGKFLLYKAMQTLMMEGERQLLPRNVT